MFTHNLNPIIVSIGPIAIRYYSLAYIIGFIATYAWLKDRIKKNKIKGLKTTEQLDTLLIYLMLGTILGGRIFDFVFYHPKIFLTNPLEIIYIWHGGMSFHGGLIGVTIATLIFCKKQKIKLLELADEVVLPASIGLFLGRIANFINAELVGTITNVKWCVNYPPEEVCRHPSQLYEATKNIFMMIILYYQRDKTKIKGTRFATFLIMYGFLRYAITYYREDARIIMGLSQGQILSLITGITGIIIYYYLVKNNKKEMKQNKNK